MRRGPLPHHVWSRSGTVVLRTLPLARGACYLPARPHPALRSRGWRGANRVVSGGERTSRCLSKSAPAWRVMGVCAAPTVPPGSPRVPPAMRFCPWAPTTCPLLAVGVAHRRPAKSSTGCANRSIRNLRNSPQWSSSPSRTVAHNRSRRGRRWGEDGAAIHAGRAGGSDRSHDGAAVSGTLGMLDAGNYVARLHWQDPIGDPFGAGYLDITGPQCGAPTPSISPSAGTTGLPATRSSDAFAPGHAEAGAVTAATSARRRLASWR